jgi:hypothetical protein
VARLDLRRRRAVIVNGRPNCAACSATPSHHRESGTRAGSALCLGIARALQEDIRIAAEIGDLREGDPIDSILERGSAGGWKLRDPMRQRSDELTE